MGTGGVHRLGTSRVFNERSRGLWVNGSVHGVFAAVQYIERLYDDYKQYGEHEVREVTS